MLIDFSNSFNILKNKTANIGKNSGISYFTNAINSSNLAPLRYDTVSFSGRTRKSDDSAQNETSKTKQMSEPHQKKMIKKDMIYAPNYENAHKVHKYAKPAEAYLAAIFNTYLKDIVNNCTYEQNYNEYPVFDCITRRKGPSSIREKVVSKYRAIHYNKVKEFSKCFLQEFKKLYDYKTNLNEKEFEEKVINCVDNEIVLDEVNPFTNINGYAALLLGKMEDLCDYKPASDIETLKNLAKISSNMEETADTNNWKEPYHRTKSVEDVKYYAKDIVGGRIVMNKSDADYTGQVLEALKKASKHGVLKVNSVEVYLPNKDFLKKYNKGTVKDYIYATKDQLESFVSATNSKLEPHTSPSGYLAIHVNIDLSHSIFSGSEFDGFSGEIQIIGTDVEHLKSVEDICYKIKDGKIPVGDKYKYFKKEFNKYYNKDDKKIVENFKKYTYLSYLHQRLIQAENRTNPDILPKLEDMGFVTDPKEKDDPNYLPKELDFNVLKSNKIISENAYNSALEKKNKEKLLKGEEQEKEPDAIDLAAEDASSSIERWVYMQAKLKKNK